MKGRYLILLTCWPLFLLGWTAESRAERPNFIFILIDDLGKEWIRCYGGERIETPNIDQLAATGTRFDNAYSMPQCTPSHICFLTGQYPFRNGWINHWDSPRWGVGYFDWEWNPSVARALRDAGYRTAAAGKWPLNDFHRHPDAMVQHGFEDYCMWTQCPASIVGTNRHDLQSGSPDWPSEPKRQLRSTLT